MGKYIYKESRYHYTEIFCAYGPRARRAGAYRPYEALKAAPTKPRTFVRLLIN